MVEIKSLSHMIILLLTFGFMLVHCTLDASDQFIDNPTELKQDALTMHKRPSFFVGSRYGRSGGGSGSASSSGGAYAPSKTRRLNVVPRNDRFFLGSRYGKRAGTTFNPKQPLASLLSTPYEQALFSEISTGTQLSNKPAPIAMMNDNYGSNDNGGGSGNSNGNGNNINGIANGNFAPASYMSCIYTGLQNFYRCNSIDNMFYVKNTVKNNDADYNNNDDDDDDVKIYDNDDECNDVVDADVGDDFKTGNVNEVLSTDANSGGGGDHALAALFNDAANHNEVDVKN